MKARSVSRIRTGLILATVAIAASAGGAVTQQAEMRDDGWVGGPGSANYELAARFAPYKIRDLIYSTSVFPRWIEESDRFWYEWETSDGTFYYIVDPAQGSKRQIFDNDRIAAELTRITGDPHDGQHLPIRNIRFIDDNTLEFEVQSSLEEEVEEEVDEEEMDEEDDDQERRTSPSTEPKIHYFEYDVDTQTLRELEDYEHPDIHPTWATVSPDTQWVVYAKDFNLWKMSYEEYQKILDARRGKQGDEAEEAEEEVEVEETQLTTDGVEHYTYGFQGRGDNDDETEEEYEKRQNAAGAFSHDGRYFALTRVDRREVGDLWVIHTTGNERPQLESYKYDLPGEKNVTQSEIVVLDMESSETRRVDDDPWKDQTMGLYDEDGGDRSQLLRFSIPLRGNGSRDVPIRKWLSDQNELYFWRRSRDQHRVDLMVADPATGTARPVIEERLNTYVEHRAPHRMENGELIWWSEDDGWGHLYHYRPDGTLVRQITQGPYHVDGLVNVDEDRGVVFFRANAREEGEDPYYQHLYGVNLDGSDVRLLNPGDFDHRSVMSDSATYFVDNYARVNTTPGSALFDARGRQVMELEEADFSQLMAAGYHFPEPYAVKADDGVTDIYGVMYKPYDFDPEKTYPIVAYVYPGPQTEAVSKFFSTNAYEQGLAQLGFIVVTMGNRGGHPDRSKWYHNYGYGNLRDYGLADKKAVIEQLADRHDFIDLDRVGIYGHSGGGFMSTAAMLVYPDFFRVAVSSSGNHDNDVYNQNWSEKHDGVKEVEGEEGEVTFEYDIQRNSDLAENLQGRLMLTTGNVDNNVHHAGTHRMAQALIRANKRFDYFVFPSQRHGYGNMGDYWFWLRAEYFAEHLLGDDTRATDIVELQVEAPKNGGGRAGKSRNTRDDGDEEDGNARRGRRGG